MNAYDCLSKVRSVTAALQLARAMPSFQVTHLHKPRARPACPAEPIIVYPPWCFSGWLAFKAHRGALQSIDYSHRFYLISEGRNFLVTAYEADLCTHDCLDRQPMVDPQVAKDLASLEGSYRNALWFRSDAYEPLIGDQDCPHLAQTYGLLRRSCLTVFLDAQSDSNVKCRFERCFAFTFNTVDNALKHLRAHHFGNRPFVCLPTNGTTW
jgi:hypothetical protein